MASMPLTGTIGATGESGSYRRALPDQVTSFVLPTVERPKEQLARLHMPKQQRGRRSNAAAAKQQQESVTDVVNDEDDGLLSMESSMTLLQSLRQSRLTHLTALLPYLSTRHRTSTKYHAAPAGMVYPGGLDPTASPPPTLLHLGRADVRVGPFVFPRTRFGEARVEGVVFESTDTATTGAASTTTPTPTPALPANGKGKEIATASEATAGPSITSEPVAQMSTPAAETKKATTSTPVRASKPLAKSAAPTSATPGSSAPASAAASPSRTSGQATPAVSTPAAAAAAAPINDKVVKAVSAAAQRDPDLQRLLHAAANGKATAEQLRELAAFIAKVSEGLEKEAQAHHREAQRILDAAAGIITPSPATAKTSSSSNAQPAAPKKVKKKKRVSTGSDAAATANVNEAYALRIPAPSSAYTAVPPYPPIVTIEYREHPSARFVLPLWRGATVERKVDGGERSVKVTMLLPAIGSSAAMRAGGAQDEAEEGGKSKGKGAAKKAAAAQGSAAAAASIPPSAQAAAEAASPRKLPTSEELNAAAPAGAETRALTWFITGTAEAPLSDGIWFVFGRVDGATTFVDGILQADAELKPHAMGSLSEQVLSTLIGKVRLLSSRMTDCQRTPKLRVTADEIPSDLPDHLADRFAPRMQTLASRPMVRIKRVIGGPGDDGEEQFEIVRSTAVYSDTKPSKRARFDDDDGDATTMTWDGGDDSIISVDASGKPKRKRHVAKYNPDGTLKLCQACGTNTTPMWRRGPAGKSTLCNACGAKWKVGRLVVPDQPPPPPMQPTKEEESVVAKTAKDNANSKKDAEASSTHARQNGSDVQVDTAPPIAVVDDTPQTTAASASQDTTQQATPAT